jgi:hypothetical protein
VIPNCPLCNGRTAVAFTAADWNLGTSTEEFEYFRCSKCGGVFTSPVPEYMGKYYPPSYPAYEFNLDTSMREPDPLDHKKLEFVRRYASGGRLLEIGPGSGGFLRIAKEAGFDVEAIEMDRNCCDFLKETLGIPAIHAQDIIGSLATLPFFDAQNRNRPFIEAPQSRRNPGSRCPKPGVPPVPVFRKVLGPPGCAAPSRPCPPLVADRGGR